ncbi:MAG: 5'-nucleotidase C-terminal domain-containing protein [Gemmatimonadota bacterium]
MTRPLVCIRATSVAVAVAVAGCSGSREMVRVVPDPTPHVVDTATPPQMRPTRELVLLGTTDVHTRVYPYDYYTRQDVDYGLARLKPLIDSVRAANAGRTYLFDSGDLLQGNPLGFVYARIHGDQPNPVMRAMNLLGYDASTIGNHEYNYGLEHLNRALAQARFPFVTANVFKDGTQEHAYRPYTLLPHVVAPDDTILIGVTGNTPPGVEIWDRQHVQGVLDFRDVVQSLRPVIRELKNRGADAIVVLSHGGLTGTSYDTTGGLPPENASAQLAHEVPDVDVIFLGHTHLEVADTSINGVLLTQAKSWAQSLANVQLKLERRGPSDWLVIDKHASVMRPSPMRADTAFLDSLRWEHERTVAYVKSVAGRSTQRWEARDARVKDTPIIDFINEVQRKTAGTDLSAAAAFDINAVIPAGDVTIADLAGVYVYDNTLKAIRITGSQLKSYLEKSAEYFTSEKRVPGYNFDIISGADYTIDISKPEGQRITKLTYKGQPVRADQQFTLALNSYRQAGGGGFSMIANTPVVYDRQEGIRELLIEEVRRRGVLRAADYFTQNWSIVPLAARDSLLSLRRRELRAGARAGERVRKRLRVLATNDVHGRLLPETYSWSNGRAVGGMAALASYFKHEAQGFDGATIILDGGDVMQGTPISNLTTGRSSVATFNASGYAAAAIGNHEFDWGVPILRDRMAQAKFGWLGANIFLAGRQTQPIWSKPTRMVTVNGMKVGIIGLATEETPATTKSTNVIGLEFRSGSAAIDRWVPQLRKQGADFVIVVAHSGAVCDSDFKQCNGEIIEWARATTNKPDLIVAGHTHRMVRYVENGIPIIEAGSYTTRYGVADLTRDSAGTHVWIHDFPTPFADRVTPDTMVARIVAAAQREIGPQVNRVIATLADTIRRSGAGESPLGNLLADAFRTQTNAQLAFVNNGSIRINELPRGPVTWGTLYSLQPFENRLVKLWMTGAQIRDVVETALMGNAPDMHISGMRVVYNPSSPAGRRVESMQLISGEQITDEDIFVAAVTDFLALGTGDGYAAFGQATRRQTVDLIDLDALIDYLKSRPQPVRVDLAERRFLITPTN